MTNPTPAQEEFQSFLASNSADRNDRIHPEDRAADRSEASTRQRDDQDEEDRFRASQIDAAMRMPSFGSGGGGGVEIYLPPASFDSGRATGVKGVIADARSYEMARKQTWMSRVRQARRSVFGPEANGNKSDSDNSVEEGDEEKFLQQWRESRRRELESEGGGASIRTRRTSPSVRMWGRMDEVDALGYLDAIEKVGRETVVVVYVYDHEVRRVPPCLGPVPSGPPLIRRSSAKYRRPSSQPLSR